MANDKEIGIEIPVSAYAVNGSGEKAVNTIINEANKALKKHYIEVSPETRISLDKGKFSKEFIKAHEDLFGQLDKASAKGFSLSEKELTTLMNKYKRFMKIANKEGKGGLPQVEKIKGSLGKALEPYNEYKISYKKMVAEVEKETKKLEKQINSGTTKAQRTYKPNKSKGVYAVAQKLGYPTDTSFNRKGVATPQTARESEYSSHRNAWMQAMANRMKQEKKLEALSLKVWKDPNYKVAKGGGRQTTEAEQNNAIAKKALAELKNKFVDLEKGLREVTVSEVMNQLGVAMALLQQAGNDLATSLQRVTGSVESIYTQKSTKRMGGTNGGETGVGPGHANALAMKQILQDVLNAIWDNTAPKDRQRELIQSTDNLTKELKEANKKKTKSKTGYEIAAEKAQTTPVYQNVQKAVDKVNNTAEQILTQNKVEGASERVADAKELGEYDQSQDIALSSEAVLSRDADTGFNTEVNAKRLFRKQTTTNRISDQNQQILNSISTSLRTVAANTSTDGSGKKSGGGRGGRGGRPPKVTYPGNVSDGSSIFNALFKELREINLNVGSILQLLINTTKYMPTSALTLVEGEGVKDIHVSKLREQPDIEDKTNYNKLHAARREFGMAPEVPVPTRATKVEKPMSFLDKVKRSLGIFGNKNEVDRIMAMNREQIEALRAQRIEFGGLTEPMKDPTDTGDKIRARRIKNVYGYRNNRVSDDDALSQLALTPSIEVNVDDVTSNLQNLVEKNMFNAQTGGGFLANLIGPTIGYLGMPSIEKTRSEAEAMNQILANVREVAETLAQTMESYQADLRSMQKSGKATFTNDGRLAAGSTKEAEDTLARLNATKMALQGVLGEAKNIDQVVAKSGGKLSKVFKRLGFVAPELRKCNLIVRNINANLDKTGKALKFTKRTAEILNYSFQLMGRSIGQMWKNWMAMLNPINLIKKAFSDFMSYDVKWQRTMNVVKYNLRAIIKPFMEWLAQKIVNILGIIDIISMKIQQAFGKQPKSLFDQTAAAAEKTREEMEQAVSVSAGFDELHDISGDSGSGGTAENDLLGDIYKPELSEEWKKFAETLANVFIAIGKAIKWCLEHWKLLLGLWAGFKVAQGLLNLLAWAHNLKAAFEALNLVSLAKLFGWLSVVLGAVLLLKSALDRWEWNENFFGVNPDERRENGDKITKQTEVAGSLIGGGLGALFGVSGLAIAGTQGLVIGALLGDGIAEGVSGALEMALNLNKGDSEGVLHSAEKMGEGIGKTAGTALGAKLGMKAGAVIGAKLGTALAPGVGTAIGVFVGSIVGAVGGWLAGGKLGKALGNVVGHIANGLQSITRGSGAFQKLKVDATDVEKAMQNVSDKTAIYNDELSKLEAMEKLTGISAKELYESVQQGSLAYSDLSSTQKSVYDQYANMIAAEQNLQTAKLQNLEVSAKWEEQLARESGNYSEYIATMQKGVEDGIISQDQMVNYFAQTYGKINADAKLLFIDQLPEYLRESVAQQGVQYETFGNKVATTCANIKTSIQEGITNTVEKMKTGFSTAVETVKTSLSNFATNAATTWENVKTTAGQKWDELKTVAGQKWENIKSTISQKWEDVKTDTKATWEAIKDAASDKWEDIKESAIGEKVKAIWENTTNKFKNLKDTLGQKWNEIKNAASLGWQNICGAIKGWVDSLWTAVTNVFDKIKTAAQNTWERVKNFFSGKGFKTNSQVDSSGNTKVTIAAYATGTNYVPNDGLAYLHKGEAVIPAKYNESFGVQGKAYQAQSAINTQLLNSIDRLERTMKQGISVNGQFVQRGSDLVAVVNKTKSQTGADLLSNVSYAR